MGDILIVPGGTCSVTTKSVAMLPVSPPNVVGSVVLEAGLPAGQYSAEVLVGVSQPPSLSSVCFLFTVAPSS